MPMPLRTNIVETVRVALWDSRPLVTLGVKQLLDGQGSRMSLVWSAGSLEEACVRMNAVSADVIVAGVRSATSIDEAVTALSRKARVLALLDPPASPELQDRAILAGAQGVVGLDEGADLLLRAIDKVHLGELWLDRAATFRILGRVARKDAEGAGNGLPIERLTHRETGILSAMISSASLRVKEIAGRLGISESTLRNHLTSIYGKLGVSSRVEMFAVAHRRGLAHLDRAA